MPRSLSKIPKTKIVCTLGPATAPFDKIKALTEAGMNVARLNFSHGTVKEHELLAVRVRKIAEEMGVPLGLMVDVPGPKYRTGVTDPEEIQLNPKDRITLTSLPITGSKNVLPVDPPGIHRDAFVDGLILVDDGRIRLKVLGIEEAKQEILCESETTGRITEGRGVVTPGKSPSLKYPTEKAIAALEFAAERQAEFVALSTVTSSGEINEARKILSQKGAKPFIISKIERAEAVEQFDELLSASDGIMVARGDLGVEMPLSQVPVIQKRLIHQANVAGKPVITATQMLESMIYSSIPTRAEATDVANAVFDGTDAVMLSGETSVGKYPVASVRFMREVATEAEAALPYDSILIEKRPHRERLIDDAIAYDACQTAHQIHADLIIAFTESGSTANRVSKYRPEAGILALTPNVHIQRRLSLMWGVTPFVTKSPKTVDNIFIQGEEKACELGVQSGGVVVLVAGLPIGVPGGTNLLRVLTIGSDG